MDDVDENLVLDLGCGQNKHEGTIGLDIREYDDVDVLADIEHGIPFMSNTFDRVIAESILEHVRDLPGVMAELHRVLKPGGILQGKVPHWRDRNAYVDPTHVQYLDERSFDFWDPTTTLGSREYFPNTSFRVIHARRIWRVQFWKSRPIRFRLKALK